MNPFFPEIRKNFGFGMMRLPMCGEEVDLETTKKMVDAFLGAGFNYFDTAHPYLKGQSETAIRDCLASRHPREQFVLANKLSESFFQTREDIRPLFQEQLEKCGVEYFDFYLMHAMSVRRHEKFTAMGAYDIVRALKAEGKIRHMGFSFHDSAAVLDRILTDLPEMEFVQLQFNYVDYEDPNVESRACYEVCRKHGKPVFVMEPVKGGSLVNLPQKALDMMSAGSPASYAIRYAAGFEGIAMVLSGMSDEAQMADNLSFMTDFRPLSGAEHEMIAKVRTLYQAQHRIPCTACRYCTDGCPAGIAIPDIFAWVNEKRSEKAEPEKAYAEFDPGASACVECGQCEKACPQHLHIRELLKETHKAFG